PFSVFGSVTVNRNPSPSIVQFLRDLGRASGADQSLTEPNGELGLFTQSDPEWGANRGNPRDPQAGNTQAKVDTNGAPGDDRNTALPLNLSSASIAAPSAPPSSIFFAAQIASLPSNSTSLTPTLTPAQADAQINSFDVTVNNIVVSQDPSNPAQLALFVGAG